MTRSERSVSREHGHTLVELLAVCVLSMMIMLMVAPVFSYLLRRSVGETDPTTLEVVSGLLHPALREDLRHADALPLPAIGDASELLITTELGRRVRWVAPPSGGMRRDVEERNDDGNFVVVSSRVYRGVFHAHFSRHTHPHRRALLGFTVNAEGGGTLLSYRFGSRMWQP